MSILDTRLQNLQLLIHEHGSQAALARAMKKNAVNINQFCSGTRKVGEAAARGIEKALGLPIGWLDSPRTSATPSSQFPTEAWAQLDSGAQSFLLTAIDFFRLSSGTTHDELALLSAYKACAPDARAIVLSVAQAQAAQSGKTRRVRK